MLNGLTAFSIKGNWFRGNLHCHTTLSDGPRDPATTIERYRSLGHDFLSITDHRINGAKWKKENKDFLVLGGSELHPVVPWSGRYYHLVAPHLDEDFPVGLATDRSIVDALNELTSRGVPFFIGHPYWCGHDLHDLLPLAPHALGIEVYNFRCGRIGRAHSGAQWDDLLTRNMALSGIATDDTHAPHEIGRARTVVKALELTTDAVMEALAAGAFYASTGPAIEDVSLDNGMLCVRTEPVAAVLFIATAPRGGSVLAEPGETITQAQWRVPADFTGYVRVECHADRNRTAWTNPVFFKDGSVCR